jgi:hypothetical protein
MDNFILVESYPTTVEAKLAQAKLAEAGIHSFLENSEMVQMHWLLSTAVGGVKLFVPEEEAERAIALLEELAQQGEENLGLTGERCLSCHAPLAPDSTTCSACGWTYAAGGAGESP